MPNKLSREEVISQLKKIRDGWKNWVEREDKTYQALSQAIELLQDGDKISPPLPKKCQHQWEQIDKEYYITKGGMPAKKLIDHCKKCGKRRER